MVDVVDSMLHYLRRMAEVVNSTPQLEEGVNQGTRGNCTGDKPEIEVYAGRR